MNAFDSILVWLGLRRTTTHSPHMVAMRDALEQGRREKRTERYSEALAYFDEAEQLAQPNADANTLAVIQLHKVDVYLAQQEWEAAETTLEAVLRSASGIDQRTQKSYALSALGELAQEQGRWTAARQHYEQALEAAREVHALGAEGRALGHLADVYLHENNASYAVHLLREALPKLNTSGDIEMSSYFVGRLGEALVQTGHEQEGDQLLVRALKLAEHMQYRQYERRWNLEIGAFALRNLQYPRAQQHYEKALGLFDLSTPSPKYAAALSEMSTICLNMGDITAAAKYAREAITVSEALQQPAMLARAQGTLGITLRAQGHPSEAIPHLRAAAEAYAQGKEALDLKMHIEMLRNLANALDADGDTEAALATYAETLAAAHKAALPLEIAQVQRDLGGLYAKLNRTQEAIQTWTSALEHYEAEGQNLHAARIYCDLGNMRRYLGQGQRALKDYEHALMLLSGITDLETRGIILSNAANAYVDQGDIESADAFFSESISIAQRLHDKKAEATRRGNHGWFLLATGRYQRATSALEHALRMSTESGLALQAAIQTNNLGTVYAETGDLTRALEFHDRALTTLPVQPNRYWKLIFETSKAQTLLTLGRIDEAEQLLQGVLQAGRAENNVEAVILAHKGLARIALARQAFAVVEAQISEAITLARRSNMRRLLAESLAVRSQLEAGVGETTRSEKTWEEARKLFTILHAPQAKEQPSWLKQQVM